MFDEPERELPLRARAAPDAPIRRESLVVGAADHPAEAEADRVADQVLARLRTAVLAGPSAGLGHAGYEGGSRRIVRSALAGMPPAPSSLAPSSLAPSSPASSSPASRVGRSVAAQPIGREGGATDADLGQRIRRAQRAGSPMPDHVRSTMERGFGSDLSTVRFHTGNTVDALNDGVGAKAFTVGSDVFFKGGIPDVETSGGSRLIAHEIAHTFQQGGVQRQVVRRRDERKKTPIDVNALLQAHFAKRGDELRKYLGGQFGEKGMGRLRSDEAQAWRQGLKDKGRAQGRADVDTTLDNYVPDDDGNRELLDTEKAYYRISAKKSVYSKAKQSVNTAVSSAVDDVYQQVWGAGLPDAKRAAADHHRITPGDDSGALAAGKEKIDELFQAAKNQGRAAKQVALNKDGADASTPGVAAAAGRMSQTKLETEAATQVQQDKVGEKAVTKTIEADSVEAGMGVLGKLLDNVCGSSGDQVSLAVEFKVPMEGYYLQFTLSGKAARGIDGAMTAGVPVFGHPRRLEVMGEFVFRVGTGIPEVVDVGGDIRLFARGGANDTALCTKALSYGAYRRLGAISKVMANWWAGRSKGLDQTAEGKAFRAESWAAMIEEQVFKKRTDKKSGGGFVDVGGGVSTSTKVGKEDGLIGGFEFGGGISAFHRYDEASLAKSLGPDFGAVVADKLAAERRRENVKGSYGASYSFNGGATFNLGSAVASVLPSVAVAGSISGSLDNPASFGVEITGTLGYSGSSTSIVEQWAVGFAGAVADYLKALPKIVKFPDRKDFGLFSEMIASSTQMLDATLSNAVTTGLAESSKVGEGLAAKAAGPLSSSSLQVALIGGCDGGDPAKPIFRVEIRSGRKLEISVPMPDVGGVKITAEKTSRLFALGVDGGKLDMELLGIRARGKTNMRGTKSRM